MPFLAGVLLASAIFLGGCSQMTVLRTHELRRIEAQVDSSRMAIQDVQNQPAAGGDRRDAASHGAAQPKA
jgi:hypothetical protein